MRKYTLILILVTIACMGFAQPSCPEAKRLFNPEKFEIELEKHILKEVGLTQTEKTNLLSIYREMRKKQIKIMDAYKNIRSKQPATEKEWETKLKLRDANEIELKKLQQVYHNKMLKVIPASKVMKLIKAEGEFHREYFRKMQMKYSHRHRNPNIQCPLNNQK